MTVTADPPLHAEPMAATPEVMRWVLPTMHLPVGRLLAAPGRLGALLDEELIERAWCEPHSVNVRLRAGASWRQHGATVRIALQEAVVDVALWHTDDDRDTILRTVLGDVLAGPVGAYITSHGGQVDVDSVADETVTLRFSGACGHCDLAGVTLHRRIETAVCERYPDLRAITAAEVATGRFSSWFRRGERPGVPDRRS